MSKRKRSPVSDEGPLFQNVETIMSWEDSNGSFDESINDSSSSEDFEDDTDADITNDPTEPSTSTCFLGRPKYTNVQNPLITPRLNIENLSSSDNEVVDRPTPLFEDFSSSEDEVIQNLTKGRLTRGCRPRVPRVNRRPQLVDPAESSWDEVVENEDPGYQHNFNYAELDGPKHCPPPGSDPIAYFNLFLTTSLICTFVTETNRYARNFLARTVVSPNSRLREWKAITVSEMKAFIAIVFNMGLIKKPTIESYWSKKASQSISWFRKLMSRNRFTIILKFFNIIDVSTLPKLGEVGYNPCRRYQPLIDHANRLFQHHYTPNQALSVEESLVGTKKRIGLTQYMPKKKHHKWDHIKLWVLCDAITHYCVVLFCYKGAINEDGAQTEHGQAFNIVTNLLAIGNYLRKGFHLFLDNFFTSITLARYLYQNLTWLTGTLRLDKKCVPKKLKEKFAVGSRVYVRKGPILQMAWRGKKSKKSQYIVLSTHGEAKTVRYSINRNGRIINKQKPSIVHQYNREMKGTDITDQMLCTYLDDRKCLKPWKKVIFNVISRMMLNAYVLYELTSVTPMSRYDFMVDVIDALAADELTGRNGGGGDAPGGGYGLEKLPAGKQKDCSACSGKNNPEGKRKRSSTVCMNCKLGVHPECYHTHTCE